MIKVLSILLLFTIILIARENPFFPSVGEKDLPRTSNIDLSVPALKRATISLPTHARVIQKVIIEYKNLDGSLETKSIELNNAVDWHLPIFISQSYNTSSKKTTKKKRVTKKSYKKIAANKEVKFLSSGKTLKIISNDKIIRNFLLVKPHRIVIDFEKETSMKAYSKKIANSIFTKVRVGNHKGYYRVVVELDGQYRYKMTKMQGEYIFTLR